MVKIPYSYISPQLNIPFSDIEKTKNRNISENLHDTLQWNKIKHIVDNKIFWDYIDYNSSELKIEELALSWTKTSYKISDWKNVYKLRIPSTKEEADSIKTNIQTFSEILPNVYDDKTANNAFFLFDWVDELRHFNEEIQDVDKYKELWKMLWIVYSNSWCDYSNEKKQKLYKHIMKKVEAVSDKFSEEELNSIETKITDLLENPNLQFWLELWDLTPENIWFDRDWKLLCVDEEAIEIRLMWYGLCKILNWDLSQDNVIDIVDWIKNQGSKINFDKDYLELILLISYVRTIFRKNKNNFDSTKSEFIWWLNWSSINDNKIFMWLKCMNK